MALDRIPEYQINNLSTDGYGRIVQIIDGNYFDGYGNPLDLVTSDNVPASTSGGGTGSGTPGTSGTSGTSGVSGLNGTSGVNGSAGTSGASVLGASTSVMINDGEDGSSPYATEAQILLKQNLPTGFITGLTLSIHPSDNTKINIAPGAYAITDFSNLLDIQVHIIQLPLGLTGITPTYLATNAASYIALDINQNVIQSASPFTDVNRRTLAIIGSAVHSNNIIVNAVNEIKAPIIAPTNQPTT